ncbi:MAG: hypothetical protein ACI85Q_001994 [Salibacteraceae bacterium]|jgi:hypothetical protein
MRLGQLSRKINVKPTEILSYLKNEFDVELGSHLNTKVADELSDKVISKFGKPKPVVIEEPVLAKVSPSVDSSTGAKEIEPEPILTEEEMEESNSSIIILEQTPPTSREFEPQQEVDVETILNAELIKAPKVELTGPKVVGKIDLPPTLEEQMVEIDGVMISKAELANRKREERLERREKTQTRKTRTSGNVKSSRIKSEAQIAQIKRDKESEEMAKRLERRENRIAAKKKEAKKVTTDFIPKQPKRKTTKIVEAKKQEAIKAPTPTTWHGKLWKWFNT